MPDCGVCEAAQVAGYASEDAPRRAFRTIELDLGCDQHSWTWYLRRPDLTGSPPIGQDGFVPGNLIYHSLSDLYKPVRD